jgi:hypothetical protein
VVGENKRDGDDSDSGDRRHSRQQRSAGRRPLSSLPPAARRRALAQQPVDATEQEQLPLTVRARSDVREQGGIVAVFEKVW